MAAWPEMGGPRRLFRFLGMIATEGKRLFVIATNKPKKTPPSGRDPIIRKIMRMPDFRWAFKLIREGRSRFLLTEIWMRFYIRWHEWMFALKHRVLGRLPALSDFQINLETKHPVAYESLDHQKPGCGDWQFLANPVGHQGDKLFVRVIVPGDSW